MPNNLPVQLTSFVGRDRDLAELDELLASTRLLTLTAPAAAARRGSRCNFPPTRWTATPAATGGSSWRRSQIRR